MISRLPAITLGLLGLHAAAQQPAATITNLGPGVGTRIPAFGAPDQNGTERNLQSIRGPKGAVLVFHRSADW